MLSLVFCLFFVCSTLAMDCPEIVEIAVVEMQSVKPSKPENNRLEIDVDELAEKDEEVECNCFKPILKFFLSCLRINLLAKKYNFLQVINNS